MQNDSGTAAPHFKRALTLAYAQGLSDVASVSAGRLRKVTGKR
ncbi:MAG TPA: hypothetical protein PKD54_10450 [Pirellulaceae bacterium]|nr:hypothetical protein [Pirellulaceae bacterium]